MSRTKKPENDDIFENGFDPIRRVVWLTGDIDMTNIVRAMKGLTVLDKMSDSPITLVINSEGGDMVQGFALIDAIHSSRSHVTGSVMGAAASAAFIILQCCNSREAGKHSVLMTHAGNRETEFDLKIDILADELVLKRMQKVNESFTMAKLQKWQARDKYMLAEEAVSLGLLDWVRP